MSRTFRQARRAVPIVPFAALALLAAGSPANAAGACPDPAVAATIKIDGATASGCRAIFTTSSTFTAPAGAGRANVLVVGGGGGGSSRRNNINNVPSSGGGGGSGGGVTLDQTVTLNAGQSYAVTVGSGGQGAGVATLGVGGVAGQPGGASAFDTIIGAAGGQGLITGSGGWVGGTSGGITCTTCYGSAYSTGGGGGGGSQDGSSSATVSAPNSGVGGVGAGGQQVDTFFPGLVPGRLGGGGGGWGATTSGAATDGGGTGGKTGLAGADGAANTGGGGGGGSDTVVAGKGGDGLVVVDFLYTAPTPPDNGSSNTPSNTPTPVPNGSANSESAPTGALAVTPARRIASAVATTVTVPAAGTVVLTVTPAVAPKRVTCSATRDFAAVSAEPMACRPGAAVQRLRRIKAVRVTLVVTFRSAAGGAAQTLSAGTVTLPRIKTRLIPVTG